jgi:ribose transport system permease protein
LLTAGIDLSVGSIMFLTAIAGGVALNQGAPLMVGFLVAVAAGALFGAVNAFFISGLRVIPFIVTLATLYIGRGVGLWITRTRSLSLPDWLQQVGTSRFLGIPFPILVFLVALVGAHVILARTPFGRQIYAIGNDADAARKAGIRVRRVVFLVYVISGVCAALAGIVAIAQTPNVAPTFAEQREFAAIAAAVLGGTSLFGGRGNVFPGTLMGALLIQTVETGMVMIDLNQYLYPLVTSLVIFLAVLIDSVRHGRLVKLRRRRIRVEAQP